MICPVVTPHEMCALAGSENKGRWKDGLILEGRNGRATKVQEVISRAFVRKMTWRQAAKIIGISDRQMRRWHQRYERVRPRRIVRPAAGQYKTRLLAKDYRSKENRGPFPARD